jgi:hypothetical protein
MAGERAELSSLSGSNNTTTTSTAILNIIHFHYAWVLFVIFLTSFVTHSILSAQPASESKEPLLTGPGGKPLPRSARKYKEELQKRKKLKDFSPGRKVLFLYLTCGLLATFIANGVSIVIHALSKSAEKGWWCGEATAVSRNSLETTFVCWLTTIASLDIRLRFRVLLQHLPHLSSGLHTVAQHRPPNYMGHSSPL